MRPLSSSELLAVWERGRLQGPVEQALLLLATACPESSAEYLALLRIGRRDRALLALREWMFGPAIACLAECGQCGERLELALQAADLCGEAPAALAAGSLECAADDSLHLVHDAYSLEFRCANSLDLAALPSGADTGAAAPARMALLERCVLGALHDGQPVPVPSLPEAVIAALETQMAQADPHADIRLSIGCPNCRHQWQATFDIVSFFWNEIETWANRILHEVHVLARAYGWHERDILDLSPLRRQCYLDMVGA